MISLSGQLELTRREKLRFSRLLSVVETVDNFNNYFMRLLLIEMYALLSGNDINPH
jgi:hypothetical protein